MGRWRYVSHPAVEGGGASQWRTCACSIPSSFPVSSTHPTPFYHAHAQALLYGSRHGCCRCVSALWGYGSLRRAHLNFPSAAIAGRSRVWKDGFCLPIWIKSVQAVGIAATATYFECAAVSTRGVDEVCSCPRSVDCAVRPGNQARCAFPHWALASRLGNAWSACEAANTDRPSRLTISQCTARTKQCTHLRSHHAGSAHTLTACDSD